MDTPPFLIWSLEYTCPVRGFETGRDPERVERLLRAARAASDAIQEGRLLEGLCVSPPYGFRLEEALTIFGGRAALDSACPTCPANARSSILPGAWAGCYGLLPLTLSTPELESRLAGISAILDREQAPPVWAKLWMHSPLEPEQAEQIARLFTACGFSELGDEFEELRRGLTAAANWKTPIHVVAYPPGRAEDGWWRLARHCPRCKSVWTASDQRRCEVCGYRGPPAPDKKRRVRGRRPYVLLQRLMGETAVRDLLRQYEDGRGLLKSPAPAQTRLPVERPGTLPGD